MEHIILTAEQADQVRGESSPGAMLDPIKLEDDRYILPADVLSDEAHKAKWPLLVDLPREVLK